MMAPRLPSPQPPRPPPCHPRPHASTQVFDPRYFFPPHPVFGSVRGQEGHVGVAATAILGMAGRVEATSKVSCVGKERLVVPCTNSLESRAAGTGAEEVRARHRSQLEAEQPPAPPGGPVPAAVGEPPKPAPVSRRKKCGFTGCKVRHPCGWLALRHRPSARPSTAPRSCSPSLPTNTSTCRSSYVFPNDFS